MGCFFIYFLKKLCIYLAESHLGWDTSGDGIFFHFLFKKLCIYLTESHLGWDTWVSL